jgi:hypothetical protein
MEIAEIYLTKLDRVYVDYLKEFYIENDQIPPYAKLANDWGLSREYAKLILKRLEESALLVKNDCDGYRWTRKRYVILPKKAAFGGGRML